MKRPDSILQKYYISKLPKYQQRPGTVLQQRYGVGPMMGDLAQQSGVPSQEDIARQMQIMRQKQEQERMAAARARYEAMPKIGPAKQLNYSEQVEADQRRKRLNEQYADQNPEVTLNEFGDIVPSGYGRFMQTYGPNIEKFGRSLETPLAIQGVGELAYGLGKVGAKYLPQVGEYLTTQTPLRNTYRLNPWAFKPNPEAYYRGIGRTGLDDAMESGVLRSNRKGNFGDDLYVSNSFNEADYYANNRMPWTIDEDGKVVDDLIKGKGIDTKKYFAEIPKQNVNVTPHYINNTQFISKDVIPLDNIKLLKQHWLRGYKEVPKPTSTQSITRGPINYWEDPKFIQNNPGFSHEAYVNSAQGIGKNFQDISEHLRPTLIDEAGNPITMEEALIKRLPPRIPTAEELALSQRLKDRNARVIEALKNRGKKKEGGPILNSNGYIDGRPPQGSNWRIPGNKITMDLPGMPDRILAVPNVGLSKFVYRGEDAEFSGADYVDEYEMQNGGSLPTYQGTEGSGIIPVFKTQADRRKYQRNLKKIGEDVSKIFNFTDEMYISGIPEEKRLASEKYSKRFYAENPYNPFNCINAVGGVCIESGIRYSNPTDKDRYLGNPKFLDAVKAGKEDFYIYDGNDYQPGDQLVYLGNDGTAYHSKIIYDKSKNKVSILDNSGGQAFHTQTQNKDIIKNLQKDGRVLVIRPGRILDKKDNTQRLAENTWAFTPQSKETLLKMYQDYDAIQREKQRNLPYTYSLNPEGPLAQTGNKNLKGVEEFLNFANDEKNINYLVDKLYELKRPGLANKERIHRSLLNVFGILGQENKWEDRTFGGSGFGLENAYEKIFNPKDASIGPGQIKFATLGEDFKKAFDIKKPEDLRDWKKLIPLMTAIDLTNQQEMLSWGKSFSERIIGEPGLAADEMKWDVATMSPYFYQGRGYKNIKEGLNKEFDYTMRGDLRKLWNWKNPTKILGAAADRLNTNIEYGSFGDDLSYDDFKYKIRTADQYNKAKADNYRENIRSRQKVFDPGSYGRNVWENWANNILRTRGSGYNPETATPGSEALIFPGSEDQRINAMLKYYEQLYGPAGKLQNRKRGGLTKYQERPGTVIRDNIPSLGDAFRRAEMDRFKKQYDVDIPAESSFAFMEDWMNSPMYKMMLTSSALKTPGPRRRIDYTNMINRGWGYKFPEQESEFDEINHFRRLALKRFKENPNSFLNVQLEPLVKGAYTPSRNVIELSKDLKFPERLLTGVHEVSHATDINEYDDRYIPISDVNKMKRYAEDYQKQKGFWQKFTDNSGYNKYVADPTETRARLNTLRFFGKQRGVYNPFKEKLIDKNKLKSFEDQEAYQQLRLIYSDDQILDMLNSISMTPNQGLPQAKSGGQHGGPIMGDTFTPYSRDYLTNFRNEWVATYNKPIPYRIPRDDRFDEFYHQKVNTIPQYYKTIPAWVKGLGTDMEEYREGDKNIPPKSMGKLAKGYEWVENYRTGPFRDDSQIREYTRLIKSIRNTENRKPIWNRDVKFVLKNGGQHGGLDRYQQRPGTIRPIYISDPNDPRLRRYQDSLSLYNLSEKNRQIFSKYDPTYVEYPEGYSTKNKNFETEVIKHALRRAERDLAEHRGPSENAQMLKSMSNIALSSGIRPQGSYISGNSDITGFYAPSYKKPVQSVVYKKATVPKQKLVTRFQKFEDIDLPEQIQFKDLPQPNLGYKNAAPQPELISQTPTNYSYTYPTGKYNEQKTIYFPSKSTWKAFTDQFDGLNTTEQAGSFSATPGVYTYKRRSNPVFENIEYKNGGQHGGLDRWFAEKWVDIKTGKPCGRQEGEDRGYPACRPSKRVSSKTPKTSSELSSEERARFKSAKTSSQRIPYSHKRRK